jgi:hypothetical protein
MRHWKTASGSAGDTGCRWKVTTVPGETSCGSGMRPAGVFELLSGKVLTSLAKPLAALIVRGGLSALCEQTE